MQWIYNELSSSEASNPPLIQQRQKLGVQWQVKTALWQSTTQNTQFSVSVTLKGKITDPEKEWVRSRLQEMLSEQGIGRGTASGFGRLGNVVREGRWQIKLVGMKPTIQSRNRKDKHEGEYRWSPQVLRACLRGYFTRLALISLKKEDAKKLTELVFGGTKNPARLLLSSYLSQGLTKTGLPLEGSPYANIPKDIADSIWIIDVEGKDLDVKRNQDDILVTLVDYLLSLASRLGGLGPGWRRPPHTMREGSVYRGNQFEVNASSNSLNLTELLEKLQRLILDLANQYKLTVSKSSPSIDLLQKFFMV